MGPILNRALRAQQRRLLGMVVYVLCSAAQALPGPELVPAPKSFSEPQGLQPQQVATGQAADGRIVAAFISDGRLYVQRVTAAGALDGAVTQILQGNGKSLSSLTLAVGGAGHYAVGAQVGEGRDSRVFVRRFNADGSPLLSQSEPADGLLLVDFGEPATCAETAVQASNSPALAVDGSGNLAYSFTRSAFCATGPAGALQPDRTELYYRYAPVGGMISDPVRVFAQSPVTSAGFRSIDTVQSRVALQDNGDVLIAWNGHALGNELPRTFVRAASSAQLSSGSLLIEADNFFDRSAPQVGIKADGYVLSWRGDFNDPQTGNQRVRCYAQARARDGSAQFDVVTLANCTDSRALIVQASGAFDVITIPQTGQNPSWSGRRYDSGGVERGFYSNGTLPNRFLDLAPRAWAPTLASGRYLAIYNVTQDDGDESLLEPVRYGGSDVSPGLQLAVSPSVIGLGESAAFTWSSTGATSCTIEGQGEFTFNQNAPRSGSYSQTYTVPGTQRLTLSCINAAGSVASESRTLTINAPAVTVQASWSTAAVRVGDRATISYTSQNAQTCQAMITGEFAGTAPVEAQGSMQYTFTQADEPVFTLTCTGPGGTATTTARLTVTAAVEPPPGEPVSIQLSDGRLVQLLSTRGTLINSRTVPTPANLPDGLTPITEFLGFDIAGIPKGASVEVTMTLPSGMSPTAFIKCLATCVRYQAVNIDGNRVRIALTDGGPGDADGMANGMIQDPGAPAVQTVAPPIEPTAPASGGGGSMSWPALIMLLAGALIRRRVWQRLSCAQGCSA